MSYRKATGKIRDWLDVSLANGFSNFLHVADNFNSDYVVLRLLSLARKHQYKSLLIEDLNKEDSSTWHEDDDALGVRRNDFLGSSAQRLTFLRCKPHSVISPTDMIGYAILKWERFRTEQDARLHVYESVMQPPKTPEDNNFIDTGNIYTAHTEVGELTVNGALYCQQNDLTYVCAHVALRTALACALPNGDVSYSQLNEIIDINHTDKRVGGGAGLSPDAIEKVLNHFDFDVQKVVNEPHNSSVATPVNDFQRDVYGIIESRRPALLGFELLNEDSIPAGRHIIPVLGHTFNEDSWSAAAKRHYFGDQLSYYSSELWMSSYVIHDDNFGPYYCLPRNYLTSKSFRLMMGIRPRTTSKSNAVDIETVAAEYVSALAGYFKNGPSRWLNRFAIIVEQGYSVLRVFHISKAKYLEHLNELTTTQNVPVEAASLERFEAVLPESFWMAEISVPELFTASRRKFGEILISDTVEIPVNIDWSLFIGIRLPSLFHWLDAESKPVTIPTRFDQHSELLTG